MIQALDNHKRVLLNLNTNKSGTLIREYLHQYVHPDHNVYLAEEEEVQLIEFLTALEVEDFNIYAHAFASLLEALLPRGKDDASGSMLLAHVASRAPDLNASDSSLTPLMRAAIWKRLPVVKVLLDCGADVDFVNKDGRRFSDFVSNEMRAEFQACVLSSQHGKSVEAKSPRRL